MVKLLAIKGIGDAYAQKLQNVGIGSIADLLEKGATPQGRKEIAEKSGVNENLVLNWVNYADLYRINGVDKRYADLLEATGVDSVPELAQRHPENLYRHLAETNLEKNLVRKLPSQALISAWVKQAQKMHRIVND